MLFAIGKEVMIYKHQIQFQKKRGKVLPSSITMECNQNVGQGAEWLIFHEDIVVECT